MRHRLAAIPSIFALASIFAFAAMAEEPVRRVEQSFLPGSADSIHLELYFGDIVVEGSDGEQVEAVLDLFCSREDDTVCRARAERIRLVAKTNGERFKIKTKGTPRGRVRGIQARMTVKVPRNLTLDINLRAGDVTVAGMRSHVEVDAPAGDVEIRYPQALVGNVNIKIGAGSARLYLADGSEIKGGGWPRSVRWASNGQALIEVDVGSGDVDVRLNAGSS